MVEGAFKFMQHDHFFTAISERQTEMRPVTCLGLTGDEPHPKLARGHERRALGAHPRRDLFRKVPGSNC
jgi:hypothetical protein